MYMWNADMTEMIRIDNISVIIITPFICKWNTYKKELASLSSIYIHIQQTYIAKKFREVLIPKMQKKKQKFNWKNNANTNNVNNSKLVNSLAQS